MWGSWEYFVQNVHPGMIRLEGDTAVGRAYVAELGRLRDGRSHLNYAVYHDRYQLTPDGWRSRSASTRSDTSTPLRWRAGRPSQWRLPVDPLTEKPPSVDHARTEMRLPTAPSSQSVRLRRDVVRQVDHGVDER